MRRLLFYCLLLSAAVLCSCTNISESPSVHTLETSVSPLNAGSVSPDSGEYEEGDYIEIKAEADSGYVFTGWGGDMSGEDNPDSLYFDSDKHVTALFEEKMYSLNFEVEGWGSIRKEVIQSKTDYQEGTVVELTADPRDGWEFSHWEKDLEGEDNPVTITVDEEKTIKAVFVEEEVDDPGDDGNDGNGSDGGNDGNDGDDDNGSDGGNDGNDGDDDNGSDGGNDGNDGDDGNGSDGGNDGNDGNDDNGNDGDNGESTGDPAKTFTISADTDGEGSVSLEPDKKEYEEGERIKAKANPEQGWKFSHWDGDLSGKGRAINFTIEKDIRITAVFEEKKRD